MLSNGLTANDGRQSCTSASRQADLVCSGALKHFLQFFQIDSYDVNDPAFKNILARHFYLTPMFLIRNCFFLETNVVVGRRTCN